MLILIFIIIIIIIFGIITGFLIFDMFKKIIIEYHGPNSTKVKNTIYKDKKINKCYIFEPKLYLCPIY